MFKKAASSAFVLGVAMVAGCGAEYAPYAPEEGASDSFGTAEAAVAACEGDDLQYDFNAFSASLAVAVANELGRWDVLTDFRVQNGKLELSATGRTICGNECDNVEALLRLQDDASSVVPYHSPSIYRSKLVSWYDLQEETLVELATLGTQSEGVFRVVSRMTNKQLTVAQGSMSSGAQVQIWDWTAQTGADEWSLRVSGKGHQLVNVRSGMCLDLQSARSSSGIAFVQHPCDDSRTQVFELQQIDQSHVGIVTTYGTAAELKWWSSNNGTSVVQSEWNPYHSNKAWRLEAVSGSGGGQSDGAVPTGMYSLVAMHTDKLVAVSSASLSEGAAVVQQGDQGADHQQWYVSKVGDSYQLINRHSGLCLALLSDSSRAKEMGQRQCDNVSTQKFNFERIPGDGEARYGIRGPYGKILEVEGYGSSDGTRLVLIDGNASDLWSRQFRLEDILAGEPHRLEFSHVTSDGPCGDYYWYDISQPNGLPLSAPEESFVQLIFAGGKTELDGQDDNPFIAQQVSGTLVAIDPSGYMTGGSSGSSGSCVSSDILYDRSGAANGRCCIRYNGEYGTFRTSFWSSTTYICL